MKSASSSFKCSFFLKAFAALSSAIIGTALLFVLLIKNFYYFILGTYQGAVLNYIVIYAEIIKGSLKYKEMAELKEESSKDIWAKHEQENSLYEEN